MTTPPLIVPSSEPFLFVRGRTGCLLMHGFTAMPEEMRELGEYLAEQGYTTLGIRLPGHATHPDDLRRTRWTDWLIAIEEGLALLRDITDRVFVLGHSMGGILSLIAAAHYPIAGAVAMSTPYREMPRSNRVRTQLLALLRPSIHKTHLGAAAPLTDRREADYPAYPHFPTRILLELDPLMAAMHAALPNIHIPVLLIQSRQDTAISPESMPLIASQMDSPDIQQVWVDGLGHAIIRDPKRQLMFTTIHEFLNSIP